METNPQLLYISPHSISPCPYQTRVTYKRADMENLIASIKENGILQPLTATQVPDGYQLISGHRRLFAAKMLNLETVPVIVMDKTSEQIAVLCAVENIHREDLNFFEQASAIKLLIDQLGLTQAQAGQKLSLTQSAVANKLRILAIDSNLQLKMVKADLTERHARALCRLPKEKQPKALEHIINNSLNVSETDRYIDKLLTPKRKKKKPVVSIKDVRIFTNSINRAVKIMKSAGFAMQCEQNTTEDAVEYRIVIPLKKEGKTDRADAHKFIAPQTHTDTQQQALPETV